MSGLPPDLTALRARLLEGFDDIEERPKRPGERTRHNAPGNAEYFALATSRLPEYRCDDFARQILELHVGGMKNRPIALKLRTYRKLVDSRVNRFKAWLRGERGPGRPPVEGGRGAGCVIVAARFDDTDAEALRTLQDALGVSQSDVVRLAVRAQAHAISVNRK